MAERIYKVNSIVKCMSIMEALANHGPSSLADLKTILNLDKATLHRILSTLKALSYVKQNQSDLRYFLTFKMFQVGNMVVERGGLKALIHPYLEKISLDFQELVYASVLTEPGQAICIDKIEVDLYQQLRINVSIGGQVSMHASSMGRCFLAFMNPKHFDSVFSSLKYDQYTPNTIIKPEHLKKELDEIRRKGYALEEGERIEGAMCIGVPVLNKHGHCHATISASGPIGRMLVKKEGLIRSLTDASKEISIICGLPEEQWPIKGEEAIY